MEKRKIVTPGEVEVLHEDLDRLHLQVSELMARVEMIEARNPH
jgi:ubiquinone biosynthesis protein UbiJ